MKKMYIGLMALAIFSLLIASGCTPQTPKSKQYQPPTSLEGMYNSYKSTYQSCDTNVNRIWNEESSKYFLVLNKNCEFQFDISQNDYYFMEFKTVDSFCTNWYLNPEADFLDNKKESWNINTMTKYNIKVYILGNSQYQDGYYWCITPDLLAYASTETLMNNHFDKFLR